MTPRAFNPAHPNVLILCTGSVATIKLPELINTFLSHPLNLQLILTPSSERFLNPIQISELSSLVPVLRNEDEWSAQWSRGDPVLHIELRKWADLLIIAPLSAHTLGAIASGLCMGLGLSVVRAWDTTERGVVGDRGEGNGYGRVVGSGSGGQRKMILVAPAMNTQMYLHPLTREQLGKLEGWGWFEVLKPVEKVLACGDVGVGAMMGVDEIVRRVVGRLGIEGLEVDAEVEPGVGGAESAEGEKPE